MPRASSAGSRARRGGLPATCGGQLVDAQVPVVEPAGAGRRPGKGEGVAPGDAHAHAPAQGARDRRRHGHGGEAGQCAARCARGRGSRQGGPSAVARVSHRPKNRRRSSVIQERRPRHKHKRRRRQQIWSQMARIDADTDAEAASRCGRRSGNTDAEAAGRFGHRRADMDTATDAAESSWPRLQRRVF